MAAKSGAGASVSSGANYQAQIGAYILLSGICSVEADIIAGGTIKSVSFETTEAIDDINVAMAGGWHLYIQAKATIDYSASSTSVLAAVIEQFAQQLNTNSTDKDRFVLATSGRSSRKIVFDLRAALEAFRSGDEVRFRKDQPKALVQIIDELLYILSQRIKNSTPELMRAVLYRTYVHVYDFDETSPLRQSALMVLQSNQFAAPAAVWGKIVSDCTEHARARLTVTLDQARSAYDRFRVSKGVLETGPSNELIKIEFRDTDLPVGREVVLGRMVNDKGDESVGLAIFEFYRFDSNCEERLKFSNARCILNNGLEIAVIRRTATANGMIRLIEADPSLVGDAPVTAIPINSKEDFEVGVCAETHRARLLKAVSDNTNLLSCVHCGAPVSSPAAPLVELTEEAQLIAGLCHPGCLQPLDRVIGQVQSQFFDEHRELIDFDVNGWFRAAHGGQIAFANAEYLGAKDVVLAWGGRRSKVNLGDFVVEMQLQGGGSEIVTVRNGVHRLSRAEADEFVASMNTRIKDLRAKDPFCYSEQTKAFGQRTQLLEQIGGRERLFPIERARVQRFEQRFATRYSRPGSWYAPLIFVRSAETGQPLSILGRRVLLTDPLSLSNFLENWASAGLVIEKYSIGTLLTDDDVDDFMSVAEDEGVSAVIDPILASGDSTRIASGIHFRSVESIIAEAQAKPQSPM